MANNWGGFLLCVLYRSNNWWHVCWNISLSLTCSSRTALEKKKTTQPNPTQHVYFCRFSLHYLMYKCIYLMKFQCGHYSCGEVKKLSNIRKTRRSHWGKVNFPNCLSWQAWVEMKPWKSQTHKHWNSIYFCLCGLSFFPCANPTIAYLFVAVGDQHNIRGYIKNWFPTCSLFPTYHYMLRSND